MIVMAASTPFPSIFHRAGATYHLLEKTTTGVVTGTSPGSFQVVTCRKMFQKRQTPTLNKVGDF